RTAVGADSVAGASKAVSTHRGASDRCSRAGGLLVEPCLERARSRQCRRGRTYAGGGRSDRSRPCITARGTRRRLGDAKGLATELPAPGVRRPFLRRGYPVATRVDR